MIDIITKKPMRVLTPEGAGPYIRLPYAQVDEVRRVLDSHGVRYWVGENITSFDGGPEMAKIRFGLNGNAAAVQSILDGAP